MLDKDTERDLLVRHKNGDRAATDRLVREFTPLIRHMCFRFVKTRAAMEDLLQEAICGFIEGLNKFDLSKDVRIATYAHYHTSLRMREYLHSDRNMMYIPNTSERRKIITEVTKLSGSDMTFEDKVAHITKMVGLSVELVRETCTAATNGLVSLDAPTKEGDGSVIDEVGGGYDTTQAVVDDLLNNARRAAINAATHDLTDRERRIFAARMLAEDPCTLEQLGAEFGVSKERIRQIQTVIEKKLRLRLSPELI